MSIKIHAGLSEADEQRTVHVYTSPTQVRILDTEQLLDGGTVLPGFQVTIREWFARAGRRRGSL